MTGALLPAVTAAAIAAAYSIVAEVEAAELGIASPSLGSIVLAAAAGAAFGLVAVKLATEENN
jgi:C4-dicarboxylate transporter